MKTSELIGPALDWAVTSVAYDNGVILEDGHVYIKTLDGYRGQRSSPSTNWSQGGPIIEREQITLESPQLMGGAWLASRSGADGVDPVYAWGPTALIAAMRYFVASKLGDEVDVPKELL